MWKTSYAQDQLVDQIWKMMMEIMTQEVQKSDLKKVVNELIPDSTGKIQKNLSNLYIHSMTFDTVRNIKMLNKPKFELGKLMGPRGKGRHSGNETGAKAE